MNFKNWLNLIMVALLAVLVTACDQEAANEAMSEVKKETKSVTDKTSEMAKEAATETEKAVESASDWTKDKMAEYSGKMNDAFNNFNAELKELGTKAESLTGDAKKKFEEQFAALSEKKRLAAKEIEAMESATGDAWKSAKERYEKIMDDIKSHHEKMTAEFSDK